LFANIAKTRFGVKNVGSPCDSFSDVPGIDRQMRRTRSSCAPLSNFGAGPFRPGLLFSTMFKIMTRFCTFLQAVMLSQVIGVIGKETSPMAVHAVTQEIRVPSHCPACGLINLPGALTCDCGYGFAAGKPVEFPGAEISVDWGQKIAAFWAISWPAWIAVMAATFLFNGFTSQNLLQTHRTAMTWGVKAAFFVFQAFFTRRLVRKNYRSFRVYVVTPDGTQVRRLSFRQAISVLLWIVAPQAAVMVSMSVVFGFWGAQLSEEVRQQINSIFLWLQFLLIGPYGVGLALSARYRGFRLQPRSVRN
jgi:hypothetical protein